MGCWCSNVGDSEERPPDYDYCLDILTDAYGPLCEKPSSEVDLEWAIRDICAQVVNGRFSENFLYPSVGRRGIVAEAIIRIDKLQSRYASHKLVARHMEQFAAKYDYLQKRYRFSDEVLCEGDNVVLLTVLSEGYSSPSVLKFLHDKGIIPSETVDTFVCTGLFSAEFWEKYEFHAVRYGHALDVNKHPYDGRLCEYAVRDNRPRYLWKILDRNGGDRALVLLALREAAPNNVVLAMDLVLRYNITHEEAAPLVEGVVPGSEKKRLILADFKKWLELIYGTPLDPLPPAGELVGAGDRSGARYRRLSAGEKHGGVT